MVSLPNRSGAALTSTAVTGALGGSGAPRLMTESVGVTRVAAMARRASKVSSGVRGAWNIAVTGTTKATRGGWPLESGRLLGERHVLQGGRDHGADPLLVGRGGPDDILDHPPPGGLVGGAAPELETEGSLADLDGAGGAHRDA